MGFRISPSTAALSVQRHLEVSGRQVEKSLKALASGSRIVQAGDDAAGFAISESLRGQMASLKQAGQNAQNAISLINTAEGGLNEQNNILIRLRELAVQAASDTLGPMEREFANFEYTQLVEEFDRIAKSTRFGNKELLTGTGERFEFQIGAFEGRENIVEFELDQSTTASDVGIDSSEISDQDAARSSLETLDTALSTIAGTRAKFGAMQSRFTYAIDNLSVQHENIAQARSTIVDVNMAEEVSKLTQAQLALSVGSSVMAQAGLDRNVVMNLLR
jgi:flagellin